MRRPFPIDELDYDLPPELIAQTPPASRGASRLLVVDREAGTLTDATFADLPRFIRSGDLLVLNNTRVVAAKFTVTRQTGGRLDGLFLREVESGVWDILLDGARRLRANERLCFVFPDESVHLQTIARTEEGGWRVRVESNEPAVQLLERVGRPPLPPYIRRAGDQSAEQDEQDKTRYQTVYADRPGAVAAPTAGLHFTELMLENLQRAGAEVSRVTLHVGLGTFAPVKVDDLRDHAMHAEWYELPPATADAVRRCRAQGGRVFAVGTTSVRVLETCAAGNRLVESGTGRTEIFCYPPFEFQVVDALLTNFHLPRSTLLALVMSFAGVEHVRQAYRHAVTARYRFFSYGDATLIT